MPARVDSVPTRRVRERKGRILEMIWVNALIRQALTVTQARSFVTRLVAILNLDESLGRGSLAGNTDPPVPEIRSGQRNESRATFSQMTPFPRAA
jgi:hypothetical protein